MTANTCTDCGKPTGRSGMSDYLRCAECQIEFNRMLYDRSRPPPDEIDRRITEYAAAVAANRPLFPEAA
jgi:tRNA(Ile2) C34 agmatinyltransferase TiaS